MARTGRPKADPDRDLRRDLLEASRTLLDEHGPEALSLREAARLAGCSHQAPYHYFPDREALLAALVTDGFERLEQALLAAADASVDAPVRALLVASGEAYVDFALDNPGVFRLMFRTDVCNPERFPEVQEAGLRAFAALTSLTQAVFGADASPEQSMVLWAHVHGVAGLLLDAPIVVAFESDAAKRAFARSVGQTFADLVLGAG